MLSTRRLRTPLAILAAGILVLTGCASAITGEGSGSGQAVPTTPPPSSETTTAPPSSSATTTAPSTPAGSSSVSTGGCAGDYCDDFSSASTGWDVGNEKYFFSRYDPYLGGTMRLGERHDSVLTEPAPYDITKAAADYSVQVDVEAILGPKTASNAIYGISCWNHKSKRGDTAAFVFYFTKRREQIVLWDDTDGTEHVLKSKAWHDVVRSAPQRNDVRVLCLQRNNANGSVAELGISVNGHVLTDLYAKSIKNHPWAVGDRVALLVGLTGSDVFYDNFVITGECKGSTC
jgi:hypothetical protein